MPTKNNNTKNLVLIYLLISMIFFTSCAKTTQKKPKIILIIKSVDTNFEFWKTINLGADAAAKEFGATVDTRGPQSEEDVDLQIKIMEEAILEKPDIIILAACDAEKLLPSCQKAIDNNITLVIADSNVSEKIDAPFVGTDNYNVAYQLGVEAAKSFSEKEQAQFLVIGHFEQTTTAKFRVNGFLDGANALITNPKNITQTYQKSSEPLIYKTYFCNDSTPLAYSTTKKVLLANPNINAIFATNQTVAEGAARALQELNTNNNKKIKMYSFDYSQIINAYIETDVIDLIAAQRSFNMGYLAVKTALDKYSGKKTDDFIDTGFILVDKSNMHKEETQKLIYPFF